MTWRLPNPQLIIISKISCRWVIRNSFQNLNALRVHNEHGTIRYNVVVNAENLKPLHAKQGPYKNGLKMAYFTLCETLSLHYPLF